jgi:Uma2 family endonuclease
MGPTVARRTAPKGRPTPQFPPAIPRLHNGDRLTRDEFIHRWDAMPELKKAELINGVVYMAPVAHEGHGRPHPRLNGVFFVYTANTPGIDIGDNSSVFAADDDSMPQPDCLLRILPEFGGQTHSDAKGYLIGAPELIAEVSASSASYDLHDKLNLYLAEGVKEYVVWRTEDTEIDWFIRKRRRFVRLPAGPDGVIRSETFPGLWLDAPALLEDDLAKVLQTLQRGLNSPEHTAFVAKLAGKKRK